MKKKDQRTERALKNMRAFKGTTRTLMPRPAVFKDKTKYDRKAAKRRDMREYR